MRRQARFPFPDGRFPADLGAVVQRTVAHDGEPARVVIHEAEGDWCVLDGVNDPDPAGALTVELLVRLVTADGSLAELAALPAGHVAEREQSDLPWRIASLTGPRFRAVAGDGGTVDDPTADQLLDLLTSLDQALVVSRLDSYGDNMRVHLDEDGACRIVFHDGGRDTQFAATVPQPYGDGGREAAAAILQDWVGKRPAWRQALVWEPLSGAV